jgi:hypothetical protein
VDGFEVALVLVVRFCEEVPLELVRYGQRPSDTVVLGFLLQNRVLRRLEGVVRLPQVRRLVGRVRLLDALAVGLPQQLQDPLGVLEVDSELVLEALHSNINMIQ